MIETRPLQPEFKPRDNGNRVVRRSVLSPAQKYDTDGLVLIGSSRVMQELRRTIHKVAKTSETVLIIGENGTGKEVVARMVHQVSTRSENSWVTLNCPALSPQLMESELFGHSRGAFTGADAERVGRFEMANHGTILLDEISEIATMLQSKLLRVLQERTFERVGSSETVSVDVRVVATTNRDLTAEISAGRFREDLFHRLAVLPIEVPPLRKRREDIPELIEHFMKHAVKTVSGEIPEFSNSAIDLLVHYDWPGNVRELENLVKRAVILCDNTRITADDLFAWIPGGFAEKSAKIISGTFRPGVGMTFSEAENVPANELFRVGMNLAEVERRLIELTLEHFQGHRAKTAETLGIGLRTLTTKIKEYKET